MAATDAPASLGSIPHRDYEQLEAFSRRLVDMLLEHVMPKGGRGSSNGWEGRKVVDFLAPDELAAKLDMAITEQPESLEACLKTCRDVTDMSVNSSHPFFFNQLFAKLDVVSLMGEWLTTTMNVSMYTYEVAPVFTLMEGYILEKIGGLLGFTDVDGIFAPGGSSSNMYALLAARHRRFPDAKRKGVYGAKQPVVFCSAHSHYSTTKACIMMGIGMDNCIAIPCDSEGRMRPDALEAEAARLCAPDSDVVPFFVVATAGTTVYGAFDPIQSLSEVCRRHNLWLHIDGAWGGSALLLPRTRETLLAGVGSADSFTWNPHKMMGIPLQCSCIVLNGKKGLLQDALGTSAGYLFQPDKLYPVSYDTGDKSFQCGRKVDVFKLWLSWKARGDSGMAACVEQSHVFKEWLVGEVRRRDDFELVVEPAFTNVCFWCVPPTLREMDEESRGEILDKVAPLVKQSMQKEGTTLVGYQRLDGKPNFWRMICISSDIEKDDVVRLLDLIRVYTDTALKKCLHG